MRVESFIIAVTARLFATVYATFAVFIVSHAQMGLIGKTFSKNSAMKDDQVFSTCRTFMDEVRALYAALGRGLCQHIFQACERELGDVDLDATVDNVEGDEGLFLRLKRAIDGAIDM